MGGECRAAIVGMAVAVKVGLRVGVDTWTITVVLGMVVFDHKATSRARPKTVRPRGRKNNGCFQIGVSGDDVSLENTMMGKFLVRKNELTTEILHSRSIVPYGGESSQRHQGN